MLQRIILTRGGAERYFELAPGQEVLIARSIEAQLLLWHPSVSRNHCKLRATAAGIEVENLSSKPTCTVNGQRVLPRVTLADGDVLQVGTLAFSLQCLDPPEITCSKCGQMVKAEDVRATTDGTLLCLPCVERSFLLDEGPFAALFERLGCVVLEQLGGDPPSFRVDRPDRHPNRQKVVKVIEISHEKPALLMDLRDEAQALARLDHPAIATILEMEEVDGKLVVFFPDLAGRPLEELVRSEGPFAPERALAYARTCAEAIDHAASRGVLHKDLTPANVLVDADGEVTLTNFSVARQLGDFSLLSRSFAAGHDLGGLVYWAPELVKGSAKHDARVDVFGIGAVLLYALVGRCPWGQGILANNHLVQVLGGARPPVVLDGAPDALRPVLERLLAFAPEDRPNAAEALALLLE